MSNLQEKFNKIIEDLNQNIENKNDLEYIKTQIYNISMLFIDELDKISELNMDKMNRLIARHKELNSKMQQIENKMKQIEEDFYLDSEEDELGFEIICPYCNAEFEVNINEELGERVTCPECNNVIELDWNQTECCSGNCGSCGSYCDCDDDCDCEDDCDCGDECNCEDEDM